MNVLGVAKTVTLAPLWVEPLGFCAAMLTTAAFIPQLVRVVRLKTARDISLPTFLMFSLGVFLWTIYGIYSGSKPVIWSNAVTFLLSLSILVLKLRYDRSRARGERHEP